jgi:glycosyltransferase involved in cell wall biosynthesis
MNPELREIRQSAVSVVIPTHNRARLVARAVESAIRCVEAHDEIIVVDDGSTDDTAEVLQPFLERIRYIKITNRGAGAARNLGIAEAKKDYVAFLDSDDEWLPFKLTLQRNFLDAHPEILFCFTDFMAMHGKGLLRNSIRQFHNDSRSWVELLGQGSDFSCAELPKNNADVRFYVGDIYPFEMSENYVLTSTLMVRREEASNALYFAEDLPTYEDWICFGLLSRAGKAAYLDCETTIQHSHSGPRLTDSDTLRCAETRMKVLDRIWGSDALFMKQYGGEFNRLYERQRLLRVKGLLVHGRTKEAREALNTLQNVPPFYALLAGLPRLLTRSLLELRSQYVGRWAKRGAQE